MLPSPRRWTLVAPAATLLGLALVASAFTPLNSDLGWTLRYGQDAVEHGAIVTRNGLSFTEPHRLVVTYQWLFSVVSFLVHRSFGAAGLIALKWMVLGVTVVALAGAVAKVARHPLARLVSLGVAGPLLGLGFLYVRSQIATYALVALVVWAALSARRAAWWACVPLLALWPNLHGGFVLGLALVGAMSGALWLEARLVHAEAPPARELLAIPLAGALATFASPFGWRLHALALNLTRDPGRSLDHEWTPLWRLSSLAPAEWEALGVVAVTLALAVVFVPKTRLRLWVLGLLLLLVPTAERHLRLVPLLATPVLAAALDAAIDRLGATTRARLARPVAPIGLAVGLASLALFASSLPRSLAFTSFPPPNPAPAIEVIRLNHLTGNVWNDFNWGGLLQWAAPAVRVACDGRFDQAYSDEVRREVIDFGFDQHDPLRTLERSGADLVLLPRTNPALAEVANVYRPLYCDAGVCLLSRRPDQLALVGHGLRLPTTTLTPASFFNPPNPPP